MKFTRQEQKGRTAYIILDRPDKRNALNAEFVSELKDAFTQAESDKDTRVIVIKSSSNAFCAGADLAYLQDLQDNSYKENLEDSNHLMELYKMIYLSTKPVIAEIDGPALAGGCGLASVCDLSYASEESKFGYTESRIGFVPAIVMVFLLRKIGDAKARDIMLTGRIFKAEEAKNMGLITDVVPGEALSSTVNMVAEDLANTTSGASLSIIKEMASRVQTMELHDALEYAAQSNARARETSDCKKGIAAFLNKEKISW